ncbi:MAG: type VII secretion protein EssC [Butyrivibrio sp.]|nr:type VII secretion protein EssC [Butyrivibrio sp.]
MNYQLTLYGNKIYKEIKIKDSFESVTIGTYKECQVSLKREAFLSDFKIEIKRRDDKFVAICDESICFKSDTAGAIGQYLYELTTQNVTSVCYTASDVPFLYMDFSMDFGALQDNYDLAITIPQGKKVVIGGISGADIYVAEKMGQGDYISLTYNGESGYCIGLEKIGQGIAVNGIPVRKKQINIPSKKFLSFYNIFFFLDGEVIRTTTSSGVQTNLPMERKDEQAKAAPYPEFIRSARQQYIMPDEKIDILPPKSEPTANARGLILTILPMLMTMAIMLLVRSMMSSNKMYALYFAAMMSAGVIVSIMNFFIDKKDLKKKKADRIVRYNDYLTKKEEQIEKLRNEERLVACKMGTSTTETLKSIESFDARLFEKEKTHKDYLTVSIGTGTIESENQISFREQEYLETDDELMNYPELIHDKYRYIEDMPIDIALKDLDAVGFVGSRSRLYQMMKNLIISLAGQHFYKDVKLILIMDEEDVELFSWVRWLRNSMDDQMIRRFLMFDEDSTKRGLEFIYSTLSQREGLANDITGKSRSMSPDYVVLVYRSEKISGHPVNEYISKARSLGFSFLFFEEREELLHRACQKRVFLSDSDYTGFIQDIEDGTRMQPFKFEHVPAEAVKRAAVKLGGAYVNEVSLESTLTKNITLYELMGIMNAYDLDLGQRWKTSKIYETMAAPLGVKSDGSVISLDIHERGHGPHGLVAGTTGSGKSEIVQSYVLSMASLFHPYEVGFIIIDFKGGGMANQFRDLPHLNGAITNIDGKEIERSLKSIKAELLKRQELFAKYDTNRIDEYIKLYKEGVTPIPLPHLILIVDEFAELKSEQPEFMKELISAARIGRSLGVHLILATQKPAGVVNEQIWSNSRFKLCLKVQDKNDSNEVLKSPLAAEIKEPGRAYLQVGNNEIFELFQSAYSGAPAQVGSIDEAREFRICQVGLDGRRSVIYEQKKGKAEGNITQLDALVNRINEYCKEQHIAKLPDICLPSLANVIPFTLDGYKPKNADITVPMGVYDDPSHQYQGIVDFDLTQDNFFIAGSAQYGKTNILMNIIRGLAERYTPSEVTIYAMDFASMILGSFKELKHMGGVVFSSDEEKVTNLFRILEKEITRRKEILSSMGLSSFASYLDAGKKELPQIVVLLDNFHAFKELYPGLEGNFLNLCREGLSMGISVVATASQSAGVGLKLMAAFSKKVPLNCNDDTDYALLLGRCRLRPNDTPGRCIVELDRELYECQTYLAFDAEKEIDRIRQIKAFIEEKNAQNKDFRGSFIPEVPKEYTDEFIKENYPDFTLGEYEVLLGINYSNTMPLSIDLKSKNLICMSGLRHKGKRNYITYMLSALNNNRDKAPVEIYILDSFEHLLEENKDLESVKLYTLIHDEINAKVQEIAKTLEERYQKMMSGDTQFIKEEPLLMILINSNDYCQSMPIGNPMLNVYRQIISRAGSLKAAVILTDMPTTAQGYSSPELVKAVYNSKNLMIFEDLRVQKVVEPPVQMLRANNKPLKPGDMFYVSEGNIGKIKTPLFK